MVVKRATTTTTASQSLRIKIIAHLNTPARARDGVQLHLYRDAERELVGDNELNAVNKS